MTTTTTRKQTPAAVNFDKITKGGRWVGEWVRRGGGRKKSVVELGTYIFTLFFQLSLQGVGIASLMMLR